MPLLAVMVSTTLSKVNYKKNMPDIELLMEAWPPEVEEIIGNVNMLTPELDIPLEDYARMVSEPQSPSASLSFPQGRAVFRPPIYSETRFFQLLDTVGRLWLSLSTKSNHDV